MTTAPNRQGSAPFFVACSGNQASCKMGTAVGERMGSQEYMEVQNNHALKWYRVAFLVTALVMSFFLVAASVHGSWIPALIGCALLACWWGCYAWLCSRGSKWAILLSLCLTLLVWIPLMVQTIRRVTFVIQNGGMEQADGYGSPLAFLVNFVMEQAFFLPTSAVVAAAIWLMLTSRGRPQRDATE